MRDLDKELEDRVEWLEGVMDTAFEKNAQLEKERDTALAEVERLKGIVARNKTKFEDLQRVCREQRAALQARRAGEDFASLFGLG